MNETEARERLEYMVAADQEPTLSADEIDSLMYLARRTDDYGIAPDRYTYWRPNTAYALGDYVVPTERNGSYFQVTTAGTSGASEPAWPASGAVSSAGVTFTHAGVTTWTETWNLHLAAVEGWRRKMGKLANTYDFGPGGLGFNFTRSQMFDHCREMIKQYSKGLVSGRQFARGDYPGTGLFPGVESNWGFD